MVLRPPAISACKRQATTYSGVLEGQAGCNKIVWEVVSDLLMYPREREREKQPPRGGVWVLLDGWGSNAGTGINRYVLTHSSLKQGPVGKRKEGLLFQLVL